jgi:predicted amidophosphoribosyltransferase
VTRPLPAFSPTTPDEGGPDGDAHQACPSCGAHNDAAAHFCSVCGAALATTIVIPDDDPAD